MHTFSKLRAAVVMIALGAGLLGLTGRVAYLETYGRHKIITYAESQQHLREPLHSRRGSIYERNGMLLAGTVQTKTLFVDPKFMQDQYQVEGRSLVQLDDDISKLANLIDRDPFDLSRMLGERYESRYVKVAENVHEDLEAAIRALKIPGLGFTPMNRRSYPMGSIAAHVLGGTRKDGPGLEGIELQFDKPLSGSDGMKRAMKDARQREIAVAAEDYIPPLHGQHLILTIDGNIQMIVEQELAASCQYFRAQRGEAVVMDPRTGEVLALANWPTFNPENLEDSTPDIRRNRALTDPYEPGSTIKPFIVGPALAARVTRVNEVWPIQGTSFKSPLRSKLVNDVYGYGPLATWDGLVKSSNIFMVMLGDRMGKQRIYDSLNSFAFGVSTGIELPGEDPGLLRPYSKWSNSDVVSTVQGYSVMITPLQLARAFCVFGNGGRLVTPRIVEGVLDANGNVVSLEKNQPMDLMPQAVDPMTAVEMKRILSDVVVRGTAKSARSRTWNIFGKTGTAHVARGGQYNEENYTSSFIAGAPAESPRLIIAFIIHDPDKDYALERGLKYFGGSVAAPGASRALERSLAYLQVPASPDLQPPPPSISNVLVRFNAREYARKGPTSATAH